MTFSMLNVIAIAVLSWAVPDALQKREWFWGVAMSLFLAGNLMVAAVHFMGAP